MDSWRRRAAILLAMAAMGAAPAPMPELTEADATGVLGRMVRDSDGKEIGRIVDVVVDPAGQSRAIVVDIGGFMGVGARKVAVSWASVHVPSPGAADKRVAINLSDGQVREAPDYTDRSKPAVVVGPPVHDPVPRTPDAASAGPVEPAHAASPDDAGQTLAPATPKQDKTDTK